MDTTASPSPRRNSFVTVMALISLALGAAGVASNLLQAVVTLAMPAANDLAALLPPGVSLPPMVEWLMRHMLSLSLLGTLASAIFSWASWGLFKRREWGRRAFIALLALTAAGNFAALPLVRGLTTSMLPVNDTLSAQDVAELHASLQSMEQAMLVCGVIGALAVAGLHAWIIWKLCQPQIRAEFH